MAELDKAGVILTGRELVVRFLVPLCAGRTGMLVEHLIGCKAQLDWCCVLNFPSPAWFTGVTDQSGFPGEVSLTPFKNIRSVEINRF